MIGAKIVIKQVIRIGRDRKKDREMMLVKLKNEE